MRVLRLAATEARVRRQPTSALTSARAVWVSGATWATSGTKRCAWASRRRRSASTEPSCSGSETKRSLSSWAKWTSSASASRWVAGTARTSASAITTRVAMPSGTKSQRPKRDVGLTRGQLLDRGLGEVLAGQLQLDPGSHRADLAGQRRRPGVRRDPGERDPDESDLPALGGPGRLGRPPQGLHDLASGLEHGLSGRRQRDRPRVAIEQRVPSSRSRSLMVRVSGGCAMCSRSAARRKWSSSATARKARSCAMSMNATLRTTGGASDTIHVRVSPRDRFSIGQVTIPGTIVIPCTPETPTSPTMSSPTSSSRSPTSSARASSLASWRSCPPTRSPTTCVSRPQRWGSSATPSPRSGAGWVSTWSRTSRSRWQLGYTSLSFRSMFGTNNGIAGQVLVGFGTDEQRSGGCPGSPPARSWRPSRSPSRAPARTPPVCAPPPPPTATAG